MYFSTWDMSVNSQRLHQTLVTHADRVDQGHLGTHPATGTDPATTRTCPTVQFEQPWTLKECLQTARSALFVEGVLHSTATFQPLKSLIALVHCTEIHQNGYSSPSRTWPQVSLDIQISCTFLKAAPNVFLSTSYYVPTFTNPSKIGIQITYTPCRHCLKFYNIRHLKAKTRRQY